MDAAVTETTLHRSFVPSANVALLKESATMAVASRARALKAAGRTVIDLGAGEPDFDTPEFIRRAAQRAIDAGATHYTATEGILPLREAIAAQASAECRGNSPIDPKDVVVSNGSKQSLFNACFVLFGPGDEVLIPTPSWTSYYEMVALARATVVPVLGDPANGLKVSAEMLAAAATPRTKGVLLNSPCNPTGAVYDREELRAILALAEERGWWVISDEIYRRISYDGIAVSALELASTRDPVLRELRTEPRLEYVHPAGAFYLYARVGDGTSGGDAGTAFAQQLLERHEVAIVPGAAFLTPDWVRISYAAPLEQVVTGVHRLIAAYQEVAR
jgi:aspartate aminotransferase